MTDAACSGHGGSVFLPPDGLIGDKDMIDTIDIAVNKMIKDFYSDTSKNIPPNTPSPLRKTNFYLKPDF